LPRFQLASSNRNQRENNMSRTHTIALLLATAFISTLATIQAHAVQRTHVSAAIGDDINTAANCTPVAPCRTFQAAMTVTDTNGEVIVLDSGGYGIVKITQSVALIAPKGVYAGISVFEGSDGITIATPGTNVVLRGLSVNGQGGNSGIVMTAGNKLTVENCVISNFNTVGIRVTGKTSVRITDTIIDGVNGVELQNGANGRINRTIIGGQGTSFAAGISVNGFLDSTITTADIADSTISGSRRGVMAFSNKPTAVVKVSIRDSRIVQNLDFGLLADSTKGAIVSLSASNNIVSNNGFGIFASRPGAKIWASGNTVSDNSDAGLVNSDGTFNSDGNNAVRNNGTDSIGSIVKVDMK
jgi:Right handed beta helix region